VGSTSFGSMGIAQADVLLARDSWRLVEAVTGATSANDLSERLRGDETIRVTVILSGALIVALWIATKT
jgi:hypothetical protein